MDSGCQNCTGKDVSFMAVQAVFMGDSCFCVITWICAQSCLIYHKENTKATQPNLPIQHWRYAPWIAGSYLFNSFT